MCKHRPPPGEARRLLQTCSATEDEELSALAAALTDYVDNTDTATMDHESLPEETQLEIDYWLSKAAQGRGQIARARRHCRQALRSLPAAPLFAQRLQLLASELRDAS